MGDVTHRARPLIESNVFTHTVSAFHDINEGFYGVYYRLLRIVNTQESFL